MIGQEGARSATKQSNQRRPSVKMKKRKKKRRSFIKIAAILSAAEASSILRVCRATWLLIVAVAAAAVALGPQSSAALLQVPNRHTVASIPGELVLGILVPVHERPSPKQAQTRTCGAVREQYGIQRVEAAFRTIDSINNDRNILPNITLGIEIRDSCWHSPIALEQSIEFIRDAMAASEQNQARSPGVSPGPAGFAAGSSSSSQQLAAIGSPSSPDQPQQPLANSSTTAAMCAPLLRQQQQQQTSKKVKNIVGVVGPASSTDTVQVSWSDFDCTYLIMPRLL